MKKLQLFIAAFGILLIFSNDSSGAEFLRKQSGTVTIANGSSMVTVTAPTILTMDMSKSFLVFSSTVDDPSANTSPINFQVGGEISNATTITFQRNGTAGTVSISWEIFEFESGVFVQRGSAAVPLGAGVNVTLSCVDLTKSFATISGRTPGTQLGNDDGLTADITTSTNLHIETGTAGGAWTLAYWQVIEYQGSVVKKVTATIGNLATSATSDLTVQTGSPVTDVNKTMVLSNHIIGGNINAIDLPRTELTDANTVTYTRVGTNLAMDFITYVIEFTDQTTVARATQNFASTVTSQVAAITAASSSGVIGPGNFGRQGSTDYPGTGNTGDNTGHVWFTYEITSPSTLLIQRATGTSGGNSSADAPWQIVTFQDLDNGLQTSTFYSIGSGDWEASTNWSYTPDGSSGAVPLGVYPRRTNNVVIQNGNTITINSVTDNEPCSQSPTNLGIANVSDGGPGVPFTGSGDQMFYHTGDILIANGGTLTSIEEVMIAGYTLVENGGAMNVSEDIVNLGYFEIAGAATFSNIDDLILSGNSITIIDNTSTGFDDIYIDWTDATLCGEGIMSIGNGGADPEIQYFNGATNAQICSSFTITCSINCGVAPFDGTATGGFSSGNSGPGGVGSTTGSGDVRLWLDANSINQADATNVTTWADQSGYGNDAAAVGGNEPVFNTSQINGFPSIAFTNANSDYLFVTDDASLDVSTVSLFAVGNLTSSSSSQAAFVGKLDTWTPSQGYFLGKRGTNQDVQFVIDNTANRSFGGITYGTDVIMAGIYDQVNVELFLNETSAGQDPFTGAITASGRDLLIGASDEPISRFLDGDLAETFVIGRNINLAERIIIDNYLSAKYNIGLGANDVYTRDNTGFDYEVAGVGQAADGSYHKDARGTGIVRVWNPNAIDNSDFLMWGHDNGGLTGSTDVDGVVIEERLTQIWGVSETADVGTVSISFDFNGIGNPLGSNLRLLIDRDNDFTTNDVTPIVGTVSGNKVVFSNVNFQDLDRFTLGNTDASIPLPIELLSFDAVPHDSHVLVNWSTASELNNDFFTVQKSIDAEQWDEVATIQGAGTSKKPHYYEVTDSQPLNGVSYYRLKQTDYDGQFEFSKIASVKFNGISELRISPNPSTGIFTVQDRHLESSQLRLYNSVGQVLRIESSFHDSDTQINISSFPVGVYILQVADGSFLRSVRIVKR